MVNIYCEGGVVLGTIAWYALGKLGRRRRIPYVFQKAARNCSPRSHFFFPLQKPLQSILVVHSHGSGQKRDSGSQSHSQAITRHRGL